MSEHRVLRSPLLVLLTGLVATMLALLLTLSGAEFTTLELARALTVGVFSTAVSAVTAGWQRHALEKDARSLSQAEHDAKHDRPADLVVILAAFICI